MAKEKGQLSLMKLRALRFERERRSADILLKALITGLSVSLAMLLIIYMIFVVSSPKDYVFLDMAFRKMGI